MLGRNKAIPLFIAILSALPVYAGGIEEVPSVKEHGDLIWLLMMVFAAGLLSTCLWIFNTINKNIDRLNKSIEEVNETLADEVFPRLAENESCTKSICTAHNINHPGQNLSC